MPDQKTMWTSCLGGFSVMWVTKLLISEVKKRIFCPKTTKFGPKLAFLVNLGQAMQAYSMPCCGSFDGCGARAVSRKTPIYFMIWPKEVTFVSKTQLCNLVQKVLNSALLCKEIYFAKSQISVKGGFPDLCISHSIFTSPVNQRMCLCSVNPKKFTKT